VTVTVEWETDTERMVRCDHEGTTDDTTAISVCSACGQTWPTRFGAGAPTVGMIEKQSE
jgi:hypothetical protein